MNLCVVSTFLLLEAHVGDVGSVPYHYNKPNVAISMKIAMVYTQIGGCMMVE